MQSSTQASVSIAAESPPPRLHYPNFFWILFAHVMGVAAFWFFTWEALAVCLVGLFVLAPLGINLGYHRLLTHRGLKVPQWLEYTLTTFGALIGGGPPMHWVAEHRLHHRFSDTDQDPHDSRRGFWWAHVTHLFYHKDFEDIEEQWVKYVPDMNSHRYYRILNKYWIALPIATLPLLYAWGGWSFVFWGGFVRTLLTLHIMWFVNSASHLWGYKNYATDDNSKNCWWVGIIGAGEGWHNNHHANPVSAAHGHRWWELDLTFAYIRALEFVGLATQVKRPAPYLAQSAVPATDTTEARSALS